MKKVLVVGYFWPYRRGSVRITGLANYLPEFRWQPIILTPTLHSKPGPQFRVIETPYHDVLGFWKRLFRSNPDEDIRKEIKRRFGITSKKSPMDFILTLGGEIINYPDPDKGWKPFALSQGRKLLQQESIDGIISSSTPVTSHIIANELKGRHEIPWLADFRDLWSQNHNYSYGPLRKLLDRRLELKTLAKADALITTSEPWAEKLRVLHQGKPVYTITHGFDSAKVNTPPAKLTAKFTITYTGTIYTGKQDPAKLFAALRDLISSGIVNPDDIEVRFYGSELGWLGKEIEQYGLSSVVKQYGTISWHTAIEKEKESQLLLLLDWEDPQEKGVYTGKIFEYLGARRPILAIGGVAGNVVDVLLGETKAGIHAPTVGHIKNTLEALYREYKLKGEIAYNGEESKLSKYTHREMVKKFADILDQLT